MSILVSAYYKIPSKAPHEFYLNNMKRFFKFLNRKKIIFFCEEETKQELESFGLPLSNVEFIIIPFAQVIKESGIPYEMWQESCSIDPEKYHTPQLGIVWCCKKEFVRLASESDSYRDINWFVWIDAGCIRKDAWEKSCSSFTQRKLHTLPPGVYFQAIRKAEKKQFYTYPDVHIAGAIILFHRNYIEEFNVFYKKIVYKYYSSNVSFLSDQYITASMVSSDEKPWLHVVDIDTIHIKTNDIWFFFLDYM